MALIVPFTKPLKVCTFCKRDESQVKHMIASTICGACICDACIKQAKQRMDESPLEEAACVKSPVQQGNETTPYQIQW